jgi:23S rRNA (adenine1618-N6)-methyltransferase
MKQNHSHTKAEMHPRNPHNQGYDFTQLAQLHKPLQACLAPNPIGKLTIDFSQPSAVKALNSALLKQYYQVMNWDIPAGFLCPAVPGRADYVHYIADLLELKSGVLAKGLDIGTGANLIYPIVASHSYGWTMVGSDIEQASYKNAALIAQSNSNLNNLIDVRLQTNRNAIFAGIIKVGETFDFSMCNPPFHASAEDAMSGSRKKNRNLAKHSQKRHGNDSTATHQSSLNFGGQHNELWCDGGELSFVSKMIRESVDFKQQVTWFTSLLSKKDNVAPLTKLANAVGATNCKTINMAQGAKASRFIAWRF